MPVERKLAAILSADVAGYSRLMAEDEDETVRMVTFYRESIEMLVPQHRGRLTDFTGDNFLAEFPTAMDGVRCAIEIQRVLRARNTDLAADRKMEFRVGLHLGDVRVEGERLFGTGVNVAARLQSLAEPGGICISGTVHDQLLGKLELDTQDLGEQRVKNIPEPVRAFRVKLEMGATAATETPPARRTHLAATAALFVLLGAVFGWWWWAGRGPGPFALAPGEIRSIAVLPLENLSGDPEQEYFADGMTEALIGDLARVGELNVISRTSVMQYKGARKPLREIARELGADAVIEGTVMRAGGRVRITAQLIEAASDRHLWAERYDRELSDVLALQSEVAKAVVEQVRLELTPEQQAALTPLRPVDSDAYDAYLRGLELMAGVQDSPLEAIDHFQRAVELDPEFGEGHAALAHARMRVATGFLRPAAQRAGMFRGAVVSANRALELDERLARAHGVLGLAWTFQWEFAKAGRALQLGARLSPNDPTVLTAHGWHLTILGRRQEAVRVGERLSRVAPLDAGATETYANALFYARQYERAIGEFERAIAMDPTIEPFHLYMAYQLAGRVEDAHRARVRLWRQFAKFLPFYDELLAVYLRAWEEGGWRGGQRVFAEAGAEAAAQGQFSPFSVGTTYVQLGEIDVGFAWLERAYEGHDPGLTGLKAHPFFDPIRSDPRFQDLLRRIGFPES